MNSNIINFSQEYISLIEECFHINYSGDLNKSVDEFEAHWSFDLENKFSSKCRELFYYSINSLLDDFAKMAQQPGQINAVHYGPISEEIDIEGNIRPESATQVALKGLIMADTVIFQDLIYRTASIKGIGSYTANEKRGQMLHLFYETIQLKPLIDSGCLLYIPWLPQWGSDFSAGVDALTTTINSKNNERGLLATVLSTAKTIGGVPFTTYKPANESMGNYLTELGHGELDRNKRFFEIAEYLMLENEPFSYLADATPGDIIEISNQYSKFRVLLRDHFWELRNADSEEFRLRLPAKVENLKEEINKAKTIIQKKKWTHTSSLVSAGIGSIIAVGGVTSQSIIQQGLAMGLGLLTLKPAKELFDWARNRFGPSEEPNMMCQALIDLEQRVSSRSRTSKITNQNLYRENQNSRYKS